MNLKKNYLRRRTIRQALFMTILAGSFQGLFAQETVNKKIEGGQICPQAVVEIQDNKYTFLATGTQPPDFNHYDISDRVILSINHDDPMMNSDFSLNLIISIKPVDENLKPLPVIRPPALHIEYHPTSASYPDNVVFAFTKALKFTVSIDTVKDDLGNILPVAPSNVKLECEISTTRCYDFKFNSKVADVNLRSRYIAATGELEVYWFPAPGAEKYDLEWLYVDDANQTDQSPLSYSFRNNATRVTVAGNFYRIPLVYSTGYLLYNVRPVGRNYPDYTTELYGAWTNDNTITGLVSNYPTSCQYQILKTFDLNPSMNWQTVTTFAEEGKQKTVTSFFCGILLNRQMVTRNNSDYRTLVDETLYDYNNRPAVHVLPAPTPWPKIEYFPLFNRNQSDHHYNKDDFDIDIPGTCDLQVNPMSSIRKSTPVGKPPQTGAAWYYSPNNDDKDGFQAFVPDAENYPFTQVEFEPDNTGRIRRQGGAGPDFKIGSGHETKYFYGQPFQEKLDRNFGSEVGYATHYKMNMVVDANRQINVSYLDSKNRVIATALAGDNPKVDPNDPTFTLLDTIPGYSNGLKEMMINLMNVNDTLPGSLEIKTPIMVTTAGNYDFRYVVQGAGYEFKCDMRKICYDCVYDLTIGLQDACAKEMFSYPVTDSVIGDVPGTDIMADTTCNSEKSRYDSEKNPTGEQLSVYLEPGSYMLIKTLTINDKALNYYTSRFIKDNACLLTFNAFQDSTSKKIDTTDCSITCETCFASLGNRADYVGTGPDSAVLAKEWDELTAECMELCDGYESPCEIAYQMMCSDVSPGGQYGKFDTLTLTSTDALSVYNLHNKLSVSPQKDWRHIPGEYKNPDGTDSWVEVPYWSGFPQVTDTNQIDKSSNPPVVKPKYLLNLADFILNWKPSWAEALVSFHPEFCNMQWCNDNAIKVTDQYGRNFSSDDYDSLLYFTFSYNEAETNHFLNQGSPELFKLICDNDPYFNAPNGAAQKVLMNGYIDQFYCTTPGDCYSMYDLAAISANCGTLYSGQLDPGCGDFGSGNIPSIRDQEWGIFKAMYMSKKQYLQNLSRTNASIQRDCYNGCIGAKSFNPNLFAFSGNVSFSNPASDGPCSCNNFGLYANKQKRFGTANDAIKLADDPYTNNTEPLNSDIYGDPQRVIDELKTRANFELYRQTGQCPMARELEFLMNELAGNGNFMINTDLRYQPAFTPGLYNMINQYLTPPITIYQNYHWQPVVNSQDANKLTISFFNQTANSTATCRIELTKSADTVINGHTYPISFDSMKGFRNLTVVSLNGTDYTFKITALLDTNNSLSLPVGIPLSGKTCIEIGDCENDFNLCFPTPASTDLVNLMNVMAGGSTPKFPDQNFNLQTPPYDVMFTNNLRTPLELTNANDWCWNYAASTNSRIITIASGNTGNLRLRITLNFPLYPGTPVNPGYKFSAIVTKPGPPGSFTVNMSYHDGNVYKLIPVDGIVEIVDYTGVPVSDYIVSICSQPESAECQSTEHLLRKDLELLLNDLAARGRLGQPSTLIDRYISFTTRMRAELGVTSYQHTNLVLQSISNNTAFYLLVDSVNHDTLCRLSLRMPDISKLASITSFTDLVALEETANMGISRDFSIKAFYSDSTFETIFGTSCFSIKNCCFKSYDTVYRENFDELAPVISSNYQLLTNPTPCTSSPRQYILISDTAGLDNPRCRYHPYGRDHTSDGSGKFMYLGPPKMGISDVVWQKENINVVPGFTYRFSLWYFSTVPNTFDQLRITFNGKQMTEIIRPHPASPVPWKRLDITWHADNSNLLTIKILRQCTGVFMNSYQWGFDDISLCKQGCTQLKIEQADFPETPYENDCIDQLLDLAITSAQQAYNRYADKIKKGFREAYKRKCLSAAVEEFTLKYKEIEHHYTLYYYDQADNLRMTIPPMGVEQVTGTNDLNTILDDRKHRLTGDNRHFFTNHTLPSVYEYNSLNQLVRQHTPDGGVSQFWYDALGRLVLSQNEKQLHDIKNAMGGVTGAAHSYTRYDEQNRITEVGQCYVNTAFNFSAMSFTAKNDIFKDPTFPDNITIRQSGQPLKTEVTHTYYDNIAITVPSPSFVQENLRSRVVSMTYEDLFDDNPQTYNHATHFSYDEHGNVKSLLQDNPSLASLGQQCKQIDYEFDILSGKMNKVIYQPARPDQFIHNYDYDADNRITVVSTSKNNITWDRDARYFYYQHGPLARTEIGNDIVQGLDYVYTLQGWIKGVNSEILDPKNDVGADGYATGGYMANQPGIHKVIPPDVAGYSLRYFDGDYKPIKSFSPADYFLADRSQASYLAAAAPGLYNGNIASMVTTIDNFDPNSPVTGQPAPMLTAYRYDQLNRIMRQEAWQKADILIDNSWASAINDQSYANTFHYDGNGNILFLNRKGTTSPSFNGVNMDDLTYHYNWKPASPDVEPYFRKLENNQLNYITDAEIAENYPDDLHNQTSKTNYTYDEIGNLKSDASEQIREIQWTVYGKVKKIIRDANSEKEDLEFRYDAFGKRIAKIVKKHGYSVENGGSDNPDYWRTTWYIHDAQGNIMATYLNNGSSMTAPGFYLDEQHLYGSSRLGVVSVNRLVDSLPNSLLTRFSGSKQYELTNHLGNVLATVSDMKVPVDGKYQFARLNSSYKLTAYGYIAAPGFYGQTAPPDGLVDSYLANVRSGQDPYPFGMPEPGRVFSGAGYRFGFNGKENDKEVFGSEGTFQDYGMRMYDTRGCRFISVDPLTQKYPELTPFQFSTNNPIWNIDIDGLEGHETTKGKTKVEKCPEPKGHPIAIPIHLRIKIETPKLFKRVTTYEETPKFGLNRSKHAKDKDMHMRIALEETGDITVEWDLRELPDNIKVSLHGQSLGGSGGLAQYDKGSPVIIQEGSYSAGDLLSIDVFHGPTGGTQYDVKVYSSEMVMKRITKVYFLGIFLVKIERQKFNPDDFPKKIDYDRKVKWTKKL